MRNIKVEKISIHQLEESESPCVWVLNTSSVLVGGTAKKGEVYVPIESKSGKTTITTVPNTWIPIDLALRFKKQLITDSSGFRNCLESGMLQIISDKSAREILSEADAKIEIERLKKEKNKDIGTLELEIDNKTDVDSIRAKVNPIIIDLFDASQDPESDKTENDIYATMLNNEATFVEEDWKFIIENFQIDKVKELALRHI